MDGICELRLNNQRIGAAFLLTATLLLLVSCSHLNATESNNGWDDNAIAKVNQSMAQALLINVRKAYYKNAAQRDVPTDAFPEELIADQANEFSLCVVKRLAQLSSFSEFVFRQKENNSHIFTDVLANNECKASGLLGELMLAPMARWSKKLALRQPEKSNSLIPQSKMQAFQKTCGVKMFDDLEDVKKYYQIKHDPSVMSSMPSALSPFYYYHFKQIGVWIFFDEKKQVKSLRFDPPFIGQIRGIAIGDSEAKLFKKHGEPQMKLNGLFTQQSSSTGWSYDGGVMAWVRYDVGSKSKQVRHILSYGCE